jgi:hypothetical protein
MGGDHSRKEPFEQLVNSDSENIRDNVNVFCCAGQPDVDCVGDALCCFDGCANVCVGGGENPTISVAQFVAQFIDPVFAKTSPKRWFSIIENERFGPGFAKIGSINSATGLESKF